MKTYVEPHEVTRLEEAATNLRDKLLIRTLFCLGCRVQDDYPPAPSRVFYRLTEAGWKATVEEISNPIRTLYRSR